MIEGKGGGSVSVEGERGGRKSGRSKVREVAAVVEGERVVEIPGDRR